jgi:hypothetical protein
MENFLTIKRSSQQKSKKEFDEWLYAVLYIEHGLLLMKIR